VPLTEGPMYDNPAPFPPGHPMHAAHIAYEGYGEVPLSAPFDVDDPIIVPESDRKLAELALATWDANKPPLEAPEIQQWILAVLGYYEAHYANRTFKEPQCWAPIYLLYDTRRDPMAYIEHHAGVHFVQRFYPDFIPTHEHFKRAKWPPDVPLANN
jgi:hypothetical protein